jgi:hypothetical protein
MKRQRVDSISKAVEIVAKAGQSIEIPAHVPLDDRDLPFWKSVIEEFARSEWTAHQLELAAMLSRTMADLEREQVDLRKEGSICLTDKGTPVVNPRKSVIQMHAGTILSFRRSLSLHARAQGEAEKLGPRRAAAKAIESAATKSIDDLIPRLHAVK